MVVHCTTLHFCIKLKFFIIKKFIIASKGNTILINNLKELGIPKYDSVKEQQMEIIFYLESN